MNLNIDTDLWSYLASTDKTCVMYGMGNGADKILAICEARGIEVADFFASDGFVRGHSFHGKRVLSYSEVKEKYGAENIIVLLSFASSLPDVIENIKKIAEECELYAPDVPVFPSELFDMDFYNRHKSEIDATYDMLADDESRSIFERVVAYKLTGRIDLLEEAVSDKAVVYRELLCAESITSCADLGAYNGDTVRELAEYAPKLSRVVAFEPDRRNFKKLSLYAEAEARFEVNTVNAAAWSEDTTLSFSVEGNRNSSVGGNGKSADVEARSLDSVLAGAVVDYIKYDVEGSEAEALDGSRKTIGACAPRLLVSLYHRSEDIFALPALVREISEDYDLYLRRHRYIPAWDLNLICIPKIKQ